MRYKRMMTGWVLRKTVEFTRNVIKNYDDDIESENFFRVFETLTSAEELKMALQDCLPQESIARFMSIATDKDNKAMPQSLVTGGMDVKEMLELLYCANDARKHVQKLLISLIEEFLASAPEDDDQHTKERFESIAKLSNLSPLEADILILCVFIQRGYIIQRFLPNYKERSVLTCRNLCETIALYTDSSLAEIQYALRKEGNLRRFDCKPTVLAFRTP